MCYFDHALYSKIKKTTFLAKILIPAAVIGYLAFFAFMPQSGNKGNSSLITISKGEPLKEIVFSLYKNKAVKHPYLFYFIGFISGYSRYIQSGTYYISSSDSPASIYHKLVNGEVASKPVIIAPGLNIFGIAKILSDEKIVDKKLFLKECYDKKFLSTLKIYRNSAEGFLYPDTYIFKIRSSAKNVIKKMVDNFYSKTKKLKFNYNDLVIASLIIKEADEKNKNSMDTVSSVIHNRLKINMPLDIDSSSIYALDLIMYKQYIQNAGNFKVIENMDPSYLKVKSPYNTYANYGLPPTPIANPDIASLEAALYPVKSKYLYYISTKSGKTLFSRSLAGQEKKIDRYLKS